MSRAANQHRAVIVVFALLFTLSVGPLGPLNKVAQAQSKSDPQSKVAWTVEDATNSPQVAPVQRSWTAAGATGTVDELSLPIAQQKNFATTFLPGTTGTVLVRYNITAVDGMNSFCPATSSLIKIRYRESDGPASAARVIVELRSSNVLSGGNNLIISFDSNIFPNSGSGFITVTGTAGIDFDFSNKIYWIEAKISRTDAAQFADLGSLQVWESAGTPCP